MIQEVHIRTVGGILNVLAIDIQLDGSNTIPIGNSVFVNTLGNDTTGTRERFDLPFLTLNAAKNEANSGDTIFVYSGTYNEINALHKDGVKWNFLGNPTLNLFAPNVWDDGGLETDIQISGNANIIHSSIGTVLGTRNDNTTVNFQADSVTSQGVNVLYLQGGSGIIDIKNKLSVTLINRCIALRGNSSFTINVDEIACLSTSNKTSSGIDVGNQVPLYSGNTTVNARNIYNGESTDGVPIWVGPALLTGKLTVNCSGLIEVRNPTNDSTRDGAVFIYSSETVINGNIYGFNGNAINLLTGTYEKNFIHNGNAINSGVKPLVEIAGDLFNVELRGNYESPNDKVININAAGKVNLDGNIYSKYAGAGTNYGLFLGNTALTTILGVLKVVSDGNGTAYGVGSTVAKNVIITNNVSSNVDKNVNITNSVVGTNYIFDANIK